MTNAAPSPAAEPSVIDGAVTADTADTSVTDHERATAGSTPVAAEPSTPPGHRSAIPIALRQSLPGVVAAVFVVSAAKSVGDPDTFWHIAAGDRLRETWVFTGPDPWSTMSSQPWRLHEWLPELVMSVMRQALGLPGVSWLLPLAAAGFAVAAWRAVRSEASLLIASIVMALTMTSLTISLSLRPQMVTFTLAVVTTHAWLGTARDGRARWWLIPLTWLWACSHGMWFVGPAVGAVALLGILLDGRVRGRAWLRLVGVPVGSVVAAALTPVGPGLLLSPAAVRETTQFIEEWRSPALTDASFVAFLVLAGATLLVWSRGRYRPSWTSLLLLATATGFALVYARTIPVGAAVLAPVAAAALQASSGLAREPVRRAEVALTLGLTIVGLVIAAALAPSRGALPAWGPNDLDPAIAALPADTVVCNDYGSGGWLIYSHPNVRPAIDGRIEVYAVDYVRAYQAFETASPGWQSYLARTSCHWALLPTDLPVTEALTAQAGWEVADRGADHVLLRAPDSSPR
ncbi:MAG: hypothetical protein ABIS35_04100 [Terracoccus sp.]